MFGDLKHLRETEEMPKGADTFSQRRKRQKVYLTWTLKQLFYLSENVSCSG